jgi:hypothetical protein
MCLVTVLMGKSGTLVFTFVMHVTDAKPSREENLPT